MDIGALNDRRASTILTVVIGAIYIGVRLNGLDAACLWFDELFSVHAAGHDWPSLFAFVAKDLIHPPLFYALLKLWIAIGGEGVFWLRLLSVLFAVLAIFPFIALARELRLGTAATLLSFFLFAVNGALIKYTQTLRMYSMLMLLALTSMWLFARYFRHGRGFVLLILANVLLVYTHYFGWLVIASELAALLVFQRDKWRRAAVMPGIAAVSFLPWLMMVWSSARAGSDLAQNIAWQTRPGIRELITFALDLIDPFYFQASNIEPTSLYLISVPLALLALIAVIWHAVEWKGVDEERRRVVHILLLFAGVPFAVAFMASWLLPHSVWGTRHLVFVFPIAMLLVANALLALTNRSAKFACILVVFALSATAFALDAAREKPKQVWCAWNDVAEEIVKKGDESVTIYAFENLVAYHLWFALRTSPGHRVAVLKDVYVRTDDETYFLPRGFDAVQNVKLEEIADDTVWLALRTSRPGGEIPLLDNFRRLGYEICPEPRREFGATTVFTIKLVRNAPGCR